jgi:hypothetical protein
VAAKSEASLLNRFLQLDRLEERANELREFLDEVELWAEEDRYLQWLEETLRNEALADPSKIGNLRDLVRAE